MYKIMIVEDDEDIRETLADILEFEGYQVLKATNGQEGIDLLKKPDAERPSLILLDLMMPIMDGWQFLEVKRSESRRVSSIPVVVISALADQASSQGASASIRKPVSIETLLDVVKEFCQ